MLKDEMMGKKYYWIDEETGNKLPAGIYHINNEGKFPVHAWLECSNGERIYIGLTLDLRYASNNGAKVVIFEDKPQINNEYYCYDFYGDKCRAGIYSIDNGGTHPVHAWVLNEDGHRSVVELTKDLKLDNDQPPYLILKKGPCDPLGR